jgi:hypothetical protein
MSSNNNFDPSTQPIFNQLFLFIFFFQLHVSVYNRPSSVGDIICKDKIELYIYKRIEVQLKHSTDKTIIKKKTSHNTS